MKNQKLHETKKLHYGKYLYKISIENPLTYIFRTQNQRSGKLGYARTKLEEFTTNKKPKSFVLNTRYRKTVVEPEDIKDAQSIYNILRIEEDYIIRCEHKKLLIYSNSVDLIDKISNKVVGEVETWKPDDKALSTLTEQKNVIISNKPTDYPYKVTFGNKPAKPELAAWIAKNTDKVLAGPILMKNLQYGLRWIQGQYIFARDENIIMLLQMIVGDNIARIDKIIYKANIDK